MGLGEEGSGSLKILAPDSKNRIQVPFIWEAVLTACDTTPVICMKAGLQRYHGRAWIQWHPDTKWASETCPEVAGMLKAQDKSTGTYQLHPLGLDYGKGVKRLKYYILTNNSIPHPKSFVFLLLL